MLKLRLRWPASKTAPWTLTDAEFIHEFSDLTPSGWSNLPSEGREIRTRAAQGAGGRAG